MGLRALGAWQGGISPPACLDGSWMPFLCSEAAWFHGSCFGGLGLCLVNVATSRAGWARLVVGWREVGVSVR